MCEEKPALVNVTETKWLLPLLTASGGRNVFVATAAPVRRCPGVQQSMGHLVSSAEADSADFDFCVGAASWWW